MATSTFVLRHFAWQAWHLVTSTFISRGTRSTWGTGPALVARFVARGAAPLCVAGVALADIHLRFAWQAWHLGHWAGSGGALWRALAPSFTHHFVTHHLSHTRSPLCHTPSLTHHLSRTTLSHTIFHHTIFHTQLCHTPSFTTPSFTHNFVTHNLPPHHLSHTTLSHTTFFYLHHILCLSFLPSPATTFVAHYWKKLTCGVIRSLNFFTKLFNLSRVPRHCGQSMAK